MKKISKDTIKSFIGFIIGVTAATIAINVAKNIFANKIKEETYSSNGFTITMDSGFYKKDLATATFYYESTNSALIGVKEYFKDLVDFDITENSTLDDYANLISYINESDYNFIDLNDKIKYFTYEKNISDKDFFYMAAITKGSDSFWLITLFCEKENKEDLVLKFEKWLNTVEVE